MSASAAAATETSAKSETSKGIRGAIEESDGPDSSSIAISDLTRVLTSM